MIVNQAMLFHVWFSLIIMQEKIKKPRSSDKARGCMLRGNSQESESITPALRYSIFHFSSTPCTSLIIP
jgi:hypothetical protein